MGFALKFLFVSVATLGVLTLPVRDSSADAAGIRWEKYVSKHYTFTLLKPAGWTVKESYQESPRMWSLSVAEPNGQSQVFSMHGVSPTGAMRMR